jgi:hypothetical protein
LTEEFYQLSKLNTEFIEHLRNRTINAILVVSISFIIALVLLVITFITSQIIYCFFAFVIPLLVYVWLITYGGIKHINNFYGFKRTTEGIILYKKRREDYASLTSVLILIFFISSIIRLISEIRNLRIINTELSFRSKQE